MKRIILVLLVLFSFSCKNNEKHNPKKNEDVNISLEMEKPGEIKDDILNIVLDIRALEDDKFEVYYVSDSPDGSFDSNNRVAAYIKGNDDFQLVSVKLPAGILPYKFRIDLGDNGNKYETNLEIKSIKMLLNENTIEIDNTTMDSFLQPNIYLEKTDSGGYLRKVVDGKYDPFLLAKPILIKKMEIEL